MIQDPGKQKQEAEALLGEVLNKILTGFPEGTKITLIVRDPAQIKPFFVTNDDMIAIIAALKSLRISH